MKIFHNTVLRLTLTYVTIVMVVAIAFSAVLYGISSKELERGLGGQNKIFQQFNQNTNVPRIFQDLEDARLAQLDESNGRLIQNLVLLDLLILVLAGGLSYWFAKRTLKPIEEMVDVQKRFTADASHELRTPLTAIKTEIEVGLRDEKLTLADAKKLLDSNLEEVEKLQHLSESLLKVARFENHLDKQPTNIREVILEAYRQVEKQAKKRNIDFDFKLEDRTISIDSSQIRELLVILLDNAIKYSPSGSAVTVRSTTINHNLSIQVIDNGQGIKEMDLPYIFNRFYRADHSRTKNTANGYGLGLAIAQTIVENHKGHITADSKVGSGTTFTVSLPLTKKD